MAVSWNEMPKHRKMNDVTWTTGQTASDSMAIRLRPMKNVSSGCTPMARIEVMARGM